MICCGIDLSTALTRRNRPMITGGQLSGIGQWQTRSQLAGELDGVVTDWGNLGPGALPQVAAAHGDRPALPSADCVRPFRHSVNRTIHARQGQNGYD
jgi:hypothetical protein